MAENINTIIGKDCTFTGTLEVKGTLRVDGKIKGKIIADETVTVGQTGEVEADIETRDLEVAGSVTGNVATSGRMELKTKGKIVGDIKTKNLIIEQGAIFHGSCQMKELKDTPIKTDKIVEKKFSG